MSPESKVLACSRNSCGQLHAALTLVSAGPYKSDWSYWMSPRLCCFFYWVQLSQVELLTVVVLFVAFCCFMQAFREFVQVASTTCRDSRLGIFKMECSHHTNKSISESCQHLGTAKTWHKLAAESLLGQYEKQLSKIVSKWPGIELSTR